MVVVDVIKLFVLNRVELDGDDMIAWVAIVGEVEQAKVLTWEDRGEIC